MIYPLVAATGLEPAWASAQRPLKPPRIPFRHAAIQSDTAPLAPQDPCGRDDEIRTRNRLFGKQRLFPLSYAPSMISAAGFEPAAYGLKGHCSRR